MKKVSTATVKQAKNCSQPKLTIGLDLGDRSSWYCVLDEAGEVLLEQKVSTTPKAMRVRALLPGISSDVRPAATGSGRSAKRSTSWPTVLFR